MAFIFYYTPTSKWEASPPPHLAPTVVADKVSESNRWHLPILADAASIVTDSAIGSLPQVTTFLCHVVNAVSLFHLSRPLSEDNYDDNNDDDDEYNENIINGLHDYDSDGNCHYNYDNLDNDANDADDANADANDDDEEEEDDDNEENEVDRELNDINNKDKDDSDNKEEEDSDNEDSDDDDEDSDDDEVDDLSHNDTASAPN